MTEAETLWTTLTFAMAINTDNVLVGLAYGLKKRGIGIAGNLIIAGITTLTTLAALRIGAVLTAILHTRPDPASAA